MAETRDWQRNREMWIRVLEKQTGKGLSDWNDRIQSRRFRDEDALRLWLDEQGVTGYALQLLVMERFGYPDFVRASAQELVDGQYAGRPQLREIYDAILAAVGDLGEFVVQARKTYVSLLTARRTFARVQAGKDYVALALRLEKQKAGGRLRPSKIHETMKVQVNLASVADLDDEVRRWLRRAYEENE